MSSVASVDRVHGDDREDWPEDLLVHQRGSRIGIDHHGGLDPALIAIDRTARGDPAAGAGQEALQAGEVARVDDAGPGETGIGSLHGLHRPDQAVDQLLGHRSFDQHVVRSDAGLAGIEELAPGDPSGGHLDVGVPGDDHRALATQLEGDRGQVTCAAAAMTTLPTVVLPVKKRWSKGRSSRAVDYIDRSLDHRHPLGIEIPGDEPGQRRRGGRGQLGRLHYHGVAGGHRGDQGGEGQLDGIVPGGDDQHRSLGLCHRPRPPGKVGLPRPVHGGPHPAGQVLPGVGGLGHHRHQVGHPGLESGLAEIVGHGLEELGLVFGDHPLDPLQLRGAPGRGLVRPARKVAVSRSNVAGHVGPGCWSDAGRPSARRIRAGRCPWWSWRPRPLSLPATVPAPGSAQSSPSGRSKYLRGLSTSMVVICSGLTPRSVSAGTTSRVTCS